MVRAKGRSVDQSGSIWVNLATRKATLPSIKSLKVGRCLRLCVRALSPSANITMCNKGPRGPLQSLWQWATQDWAQNVQTGGTDSG